MDAVGKIESSEFAKMFLGRLIVSESRFFRSVEMSLIILLS
jgi:hypothetical protein